LFRKQYKIFNQTLPDTYFQEIKMCNMETGNNDKLQKTMHTTSCRIYYIEIR
jgi:hypothetical protein